MKISFVKPTDAKYQKMIFKLSRKPIKVKTYPEDTFRKTLFRKEAGVSSDVKNIKISELDFSLLPEGTYNILSDKNKPCLKLIKKDDFYAFKTSQNKNLYNIAYKENGDIIENIYGPQGEKVYELKYEKIQDCYIKTEFKKNEELRKTVYTDRGNCVHSYGANNTNKKETNNNTKLPDYFYRFVTLEKY